MVLAETSRWELTYSDWMGLASEKTLIPSVYVRGHVVQLSLKDGDIWVQVLHFLQVTSCFMKLHENRIKQTINFERQFEVFVSHQNSQSVSQSGERTQKTAS